MSSLFEIDIDEALAAGGYNQEQLFTNFEAEQSDELQQQQQSLMSIHRGEFDQYDKVRNNPEVISTPVYNEPSNYVGRNLHRVTLNNSENNNDNELLLCHVPTFLRYSTDKGPSCQIAYSASAAAILAMLHFNNGDGSVVPELDGINSTPGTGLYMGQTFDRPTSGHCTSVGNQPQIKSGGVLESSALALHDCTIGQIPISLPCERVPLEK